MRVRASYDVFEVCNCGSNANETTWRTIRGSGLFYFQYPMSQVAADRGCERDVVYRMNEGYKAWVALQSVF